MCQIDRETIAIEVLRDIALDDKRMLAERQRAIDALTLFPDLCSHDIGIHCPQDRPGGPQGSFQALHPEDQGRGAPEHVGSMRRQSL